MLICSAIIKSTSSTSSTKTRSSTPLPDIPVMCQQDEKIQTKFTTSVSAKSGSNATKQKKFSIWLEQAALHIFVFLLFFSHLYPSSIYGLAQVAHCTVHRLAWSGTTNGQERSRSRSRNNLCLKICLEQAALHICYSFCFCTYAPAQYLFQHRFAQAGLVRRNHQRSAGEE